MILSKKFSNEIITEIFSYLISSKDISALNDTQTFYTTKKKILSVKKKLLKRIFCECCNNSQYYAFKKRIGKKIHYCTGCGCCNLDN
jgi:hypothetical protein